MKTPIKQSHLVTFKDGTQAKVCCGPAILALGDNVSAYVPIPEMVQCQNLGNIDRCPIRAMRQEARKKIEKKISVLRTKASLLSEEADRLERRIK
jgi:hypothetical protein